MAIAEVLEQRAFAARRRGNIYLGLGAVLALALTFYCVTLTRMAFQLNAQALAEIGRAQLEQSLPGGRAQLGAHLRNAAPQLVSQLLESIVQGTAHIRPLLLEGLEGRLDALTEELAARLGEELSRAVARHQAELDATMPGMSEEERVEAIVTHVSETFQAQFTEAVAALHPQFVAEIERVRGRVERYSKASDEDLTTKERIHRDIIRTMLQLAMLEKSEERSARS